MSAVPSALPSSTTITSKSGVSSAAVLTVRITMLAMVPLSLYAGKKTLRPAGLLAEGADMSKKRLNHSTNTTWREPPEGGTERGRRRDGEGTERGRRRDGEGT